MLAARIVIGGLAALLVVGAVLLFIGRGDWLIAGYNTASPKEKERCHIGRLRLLMGVFCLYLSGVLVGVFYISAGWYPVLPILVSAILLLILANTWAIKD